MSMLLSLYYLGSTFSNQQKRIFCFTLLLFYQRDFSRGFASFTFQARPSISFPFSASIADFHSVDSSIYTNAKPVDRLYTRSMITYALLTFPSWLNAARNCSSVTL